LGRLRYRARQRLQTRDIAALLGTAKRRRAATVSVQMRANGLTESRLGLIVPKRHVPRAVDRNRIKRLLREWFRLNQDALQGSDVLVRVTSPIAGPYESVVADVSRLALSRT
jgi:ribonuclease P protein component